MLGLGDALQLAKAKLTEGRFGPATTKRTVNDHLRNEPDGLTLIGQSGSSADAYSLARLIASEVGTLPTTYAWCVAEATKNEADARGVSIFSVLTTPGVAYPLANRGYFGEQHTRWASTQQDPLKWHHEVALAMLGNPSLRITNGARRWIDIKVQDSGVQNGRSIPSAESIFASWAKEGWEWVGPIFDPVTRIEMIDPYVLCMFHKASGQADTSKALAMLAERRAHGFSAKTEGASGGARGDMGDGLGAVVVAGAAGVAALKVGKVI